MKRPGRILFALILAVTGSAAYGAVGTSQGEFAVANTGAATYSMSISLPAGVAGMQPELVINYSSDGGNGLVGTGFAIGGLSAIERCAPTIAHDGFNGAIDFSAERYCLDGQRLFPVGSYTDRASNTGIEYRTEVDDFSRIVAYGPQGSPTHFRVWRKDLKIANYGGSDNARFRLRNNNQITTATLSWKLSRVEDAYGNYFSVSYENSAAGGEIYPDRITYTGNDAQGIVANRYVVFEKEPRPDAMVRYLGGNSLHVNKRLTAIKAYFGGVAPANLIREYRIAYQAPPVEMDKDRRSRVGSIQECAAGGDCLPATTFAWRGEGVAVFTAASPPYLSNSLQRSGEQWGQWNQLVDIDRDGVPDVVSVTPVKVAEAPETYEQHVAFLLRNSNGEYWIVGGENRSNVGTYSPHGFTFWNELADINGDGAIDVVAVVPGSGSTANIADIRIWFGRFTRSGTYSFDAPVTFEDAVAFGDEGLRFWNQLSDVNGDGLVDIFRIKKGAADGQATKYQILLGRYGSSGNFEFDFAGKYDADNIGIDDDLTPTSSQYGFRQFNQLADMNGDGVLDIFRVADTDFDAEFDDVSVLFGSAGANNAFSFSTGGIAQATSVITPIQFAGAKFGGYFSFANQLVDVNGDGVTDLVARQTGTKSTTTVTLPWVPYCSGLNNTQVRCGQKNGEERIIFYNEYSGPVDDVNLNNYSYVHLGRGNGTFDKPVNSANVFETSGMTARPSGREPNKFSCTAGQPRQADNGLTVYTYTNCPIGYDGQQRGITHWNQFVDVNGDGHVDVASFNPDTRQARISFGNGTGAFGNAIEVSTGIAVDPLRNGFSAWNQFADLDGNGMADILSIDPATWSVTVFQSGRLVPGLVERVTNGIGLVTTVEQYKPLTDKAVHERSYTRGYPVSEVSIPRQVVASVSERDGAGINLGYEYKYFSAKADIHRGALGFHWVQRTALHSSARTVTEFAQNYPYIGLPLNVKNYEVVGQDWLLTTSEQYVWGQRGSGNVRYLYLAEKQQRTYEPALAPKVLKEIRTLYSDNPASAATNVDTAPYDAYGNPEIVTVVDNDDTRTATTYEYEYTAATDFRGLVSKRVTRENGYVASVYQDHASYSEEFFNANGKLQKINYPIASAGVPVRNTLFHYDGLGNQLREIDSGQATRYTDAGNIDPGASATQTRLTNYAWQDVNTSFPRRTRSISVKDADDSLSFHSESVTFDIRYDVIKAREYKESSASTGYVTTLDYDGFGRQTRETRPDGSYDVTEFRNDCAAACPAGTRYRVAVTPYSNVNAAAPARNTYFDALHRQLRVTRPGFASGTTVYKDFHYDSQGRLASESREYYSGAAPQLAYYYYDIVDRLERIVSPRSTTKFVYGGRQGLGIETTIYTNFGESSQQRVIEYRNSRDQVVWRVDPLSQYLRYRYDSQGHLISSNGAGGDETVTIFEHGRPLAVRDPNHGMKVYRYNAFGELAWMKDAKGQATHYKYDDLGRMTRRSEPWGVTTWQYDLTGIGRLATVSVAGGEPNSESYSYDAAGRPIGSTRRIGAATYSMSHTYDAFGRLATTTYPESGVKTRSLYAASGELARICDITTVDFCDLNNDGSNLLWKTTARDAQSRITAESFGNGVSGQRVYDGASDLLTSIRAGKATATNVQNLYYQFNTAGNLDWREDRNLSAASGGYVRESYGYDAAHRLTAATLDGQRVRDYDYYPNGNIKSATYGATSLIYSYGAGGAGPHAVTGIGGGISGLPGDSNGSGVIDAQDQGPVIDHMLEVSSAPGDPDCNRDNVVNVQDLVCIVNSNGTGSGGETYGYDANGNMLSGLGRTITYTSFDQPQTIARSGKTVTFAYGPDRRRSRETFQQGATSRVTTYIGGSYEKIEVTGQPVVRNYYVKADDRLVAIIKRAGADIATATRTAHYVHTDVLGSIDRLTDASGAIEKAFNYDPFGQRRQTNWQDVSGDSSVLLSATTDRGYTGHGMDDDVGLINMNSRLYDPVLARFISPDPTIPDITDGQAFNRYSYVYNNPLRYTDPSGLTPISLDDPLVSGAMSSGAFSMPLVAATSFDGGFHTGLEVGGIEFMASGEGWTGSIFANGVGESFANAGFSAASGPLALNIDVQALFSSAEIVNHAMDDWMDHTRRNPCAVNGTCLKGAVEVAREGFWRPAENWGRVTVVGQEEVFSAKPGNVRADKIHVAPGSGTSSATRAVAAVIPEFQFRRESYGRAYLSNWVVPVESWVQNEFGYVLAAGGRKERIEGQPTYVYHGERVELDSLWDKRPTTLHLCWADSCSRDISPVTGRRPDGALWPWQFIDATK